MFFKKLISLFVFTFILNSGFSQSNGVPVIQWVGQYPPIGIQKNHKSLGKKITELVIGKQDEISLYRPVSLFAQSPDSMLVLDQGAGTLLRIENNKLEIPHGLKKKMTGFNSLIGICKNQNHEIFFTESRLNHIYRLSPDLKEISIFNDTLKLQQPTGIAYSEINKETWVVETAAHHIRVIDENGITRKIIGKRGTNPGEFNFPTFITIDKTGLAYVVDAMNFRIQVFNKNGEYLTEFGEAGDANGYFARPKGIALDSHGNIYVVDGLFHTVQIFDKEGNLLLKFGQQGQEKEDFWMPTGIFIDDKNYIYIADTYNSRIQIFQLVYKQ